MKNQLIRGACFGLLFSLVLAGCSNSTGTSSSSSSGSSTTTAPSSVTQIPDVSTLVTSSSSSSTLKATVSGTPPLLKDINSSNVDTYFWNGLISTINTAKAATAAQAKIFWNGDANSSGEGGCRMAQTVGYAFQNIRSGGTSLCYMRLMPSSSNGVAITSGSITDATTLFDQGASSKTVQVKVSNMSKEQTGGDSSRSSQDVFVKVFGTGTTEGSAGYAADLWFCTAGSLRGYETIRIDASNTITSTNVDKEGSNTFAGIITGGLTKDSGGKFVFDSSKSRTASVYFTQGSDVTFLGSVGIDSTGLLTARNYQTGSFNGGTSSTFKGAIYANYSGSTMDTLRFSAAGFAIQSDFGGTGGLETVIGAADYEDTKYVSVSTGTLLDSAKAEKFKDSIYTGATSTYTTLVSAISGYDCTTTPDIVATIDFSQSGPKAVASECENHYDEMNFCDSQDISTARQYVMTSLMGSGCATTNCGDDFSCQLYADSNPNNSAGITTANAKCSNGCCAKSQ